MKRRIQHPVISEDEWRGALHDLVSDADNPDARTTRELMVIWGLKATTTKQRVRQLIELGQARKITVVRNGQSLPAYLLTKGEQ